MSSNEVLLKMAMKLEQNSNSPSSSASKHDCNKSISVSYDNALHMLKSQRLSEES